MIVPSNDSHENQESKVSHNNNTNSQNNENRNRNRNDEDEDYRPIPTYPFQQKNSTELSCLSTTTPTTISTSSQQQQQQLSSSSLILEKDENDLDERDRNGLCDDFIGEERRRRLSSADLSAVEMLNFDVDMMGLGRNK